MNGRKNFGVLAIAIFILVMAAPTPMAQAKPLDKAMITFNFDDGFATAFTYVLPIFKKYNFTATAYIISDEVGKQYQATWTQLWTLSWTNGWEIGSHTKSHANLVNLSDAQIIDQVQGARAALASHGLVNVTALAFPYGAYDARVINVLKSEGSLYSSRQGWQDGSPTNSPNSFDPWMLNAIDVSYPMTFEDVKPYIDEAIMNKTWLVMIYHDVYPGVTAKYDFELAEFKKVADYVYSQRSKVKVATVAEGTAKCLRFKSLP